MTPPLIEKRFKPLITALLNRHYESFQSLLHLITMPRAKLILLSHSDYELITKAAAAGKQYLDKLQQFAQDLRPNEPKAQTVVNRLRQALIEATDKDLARQAEEEVAEAIRRSLKDHALEHSAHKIINLTIKDKLRELETTLSELSDDILVQLLNSQHFIKASLTLSPEQKETLLKQLSSRIETEDRSSVALTDFSNKISQTPKSSPASTVLVGEFTFFSCPEPPAPVLPETSGINLESDLKERRPSEETPTSDDETSAEEDNADSEFASDSETSNNGAPLGPGWS